MDTIAYTPLCQYVIIEHCCTRQHGLLDGLVQKRKSLTQSTSLIHLQYWTVDVNLWTKWHIIIYISIRSCKCSFEISSAKYTVWTNVSTVVSTFLVLRCSVKILNNVLYSYCWSCTTNTWKENGIPSLFHICWCFVVHVWQWELDEKGRKIH